MVIILIALQVKYIQELVIVKYIQELVIILASPSLIYSQSYSRSPELVRVWSE